MKPAVASTTVESTTAMEPTATAVEPTAAMTAALCKKRFSRQSERQRHDHRAENFQNGTFTHGSNSGRAPRCPRQLLVYTQLVTARFGDRVARYL